MASDITRVAKHILEKSKGTRRLDKKVGGEMNKFKH